MTLKHNVRRLVQKHLGLDIIRYPLHDATARTVQLLRHFDIDCVVDVGANDGGFATSIREGGYDGQIVSFEPLSTPFAALRKRASTDAKWDTHQLAVGDSKAQVTINISGNAGLSSSILPMLDSHTNAAPYSRYVSSEKVNQDRLDAILPSMNITAAKRTFIKVDVQGYEASVLDGASGLFASSSITGLQLELSLAPLYEGAMTYRDGLDRAESLGMKLMGLSPVFTDPATGRLLQADAVFFKE